ncbi:MAG: crotonase/enoyl-CoA hydratase family protein [Dehalococcoidia bacterium]|nr:crotonase/enoyl-CoA hydratase family protein [Dehalococcoidia bacterium]MCA9845341.1 crotonase/enoyl-CoA hydratase family protein [Dehalococcoidia bacterium]MCA9855415.1 crotonase/enoyl-CoA hydratase family protein [Dehalococcoidia bacterium]
MNFETIIYEVEKGRARITLNRPEKLNALSVELQEELNQALWEADNDNDVHAVILRGAGRAFSAGYDITPGRRGPAPVEGKNYRGRSSFDDDAWQMEKAMRLRMAIFDMHKPVIAQVHGYCLAGGTDVALLCDIVIAAEDAVMGFPAARAMGSLPNQMWLYHVGPQWTKRLFLTGDTISGADAAKIGAVLKAVPADLLEKEVEGLVDRMAMIDTDLLAANKRVVNIGLELMGARTMQRIGAENDARAHLSPAIPEFRRRSQEEGLKAALNWRDGKFGDGRARVSEPEIRDERGFVK